MTTFNTKKMTACSAATLILFFGTGSTSGEDAANASDGPASEKQQPSSSKELVSAEERASTTKRSASEDDGAGAGGGFASILFEGTSENTTYSIDGHTMKPPPAEFATQPMIVKAGRHVIEVRDGEEVVMREEIVLTPGETRTLRVARGGTE